MSAENNKRLVIRLLDEMWNQGNLAVIAELVAPDFVDHDRYNRSKDREGLKQFVTSGLAVMDPRHTWEDVIAEGDQVVVRFAMHGTFTQDLPGLTTKGKQVTDTAILIYRLANGKVVESWVESDALGLWQQLGVIPPLPM